MFGPDHRADGGRTADRAHELVVRRIVAGGDCANHQVAECRRVCTVLEDFRGDRLMKEREVVAGERDLVVEPDAALVGGVEGRDRDPQLADALLRIERVGLPADAPALIDRFDGNTDAAVEAAAELLNAVADVLRRGRRGARRCGE